MPLALHCIGTTSTYGLDEVRRDRTGDGEGMTKVEGAVGRNSATQRMDSTDEEARYEEEP